MSHVDMATNGAGLKHFNGSIDGNDSLVHLCNNFNFPVANRDELIAEIMKSVKFITVERLLALQNEISEYDPYQKGLVDASTLQRIFSKYYKLIPLNPQILQILFRCFAIDPKRPRLIKYAEMIKMFSNMKQDSSNGSNLNSPTGTESKIANGDVARTNGSTAQSPFYQRGDAKLVMDLQSALVQKSNGSSPTTQNFDVDSIRRALTMMDRGHKGTLSRSDIETVLNDKGLYYPLINILPQLFDRCTMNDDQYDWATFVDFLEKVHPVAQSPQQQMVNFYQQNGTIPEIKLVQETPKMLQNGSDQIQNGISNIQLSPDRDSYENGPKGSPILQKLVEQLLKLDPNHSGTILSAHAQKMIQKYNELHQLGLNSKIIQKMISVCSTDESGSRLNTKKIIQYLYDSCKI